MYVRLAFAVAAHLEPEILIVDEVLAVGDAEFQKRCLGKMKEVAVGGGRTVLLVSHNMAAVSALCDRAILLVQGSLSADGPPAHVIQDYLIPASSSIDGMFDLPGSRPGEPWAIVLSWSHFSTAVATASRRRRCCRGKRSSYR